MGCDGEKLQGSAEAASHAELHRELFGSNSFARLNPDGSITLYLERPVTVLVRSCEHGEHSITLKEFRFKRVNGRMLNNISAQRVGVERVNKPLSDLTGVNLNIVRVLETLLGSADWERVKSILAYRLFALSTGDSPRSRNELVQAIRDSWDLSLKLAEDL